MAAVSLKEFGHQYQKQIAPAVTAEIEVCPGSWRPTAVFAAPGPQFVVCCRLEPNNVLRGSLR